MREEDILTDALVDERCMGCGVQLYAWELEDIGECRDGGYYCLGCLLNGRCGCRSRHTAGAGRQESAG